MNSNIEKKQLIKSFLFINIIVVCISCEDSSTKNDSPAETIQSFQPTKKADIWEQPPRWAYAGVSNDIKLPVPSNDSSRQVPGSKLVLPYSRVSDPFNTPDWHPKDHPEMPPIVAVGRKPDIFACGFCHRSNGTGGPENASIDGLSAAYIKQQIANFTNGKRRNPVPSRVPVEFMISLSHSLTTEEIDAAANYFSSLRPIANIRVIESETVPLTFEKGWHLAVLDDQKFEPIEERIIEVPADLNRFMNRDSRVEFVAYVPVGSIDKGKHLSTSVAGGPSCVSCHGEGLNGMGDIPRLAGRSPSYLVRQLHDFQTGFRLDSTNGMMELVSQKLSSSDIIALAAYIASLEP